ncbi:hypothetical protein [Parapedobacter sp. DT-150]|uniref:tellurite resistance TerB family protein n=1 Tax=Parapedobacter sp. DT-150 TaxID=3396162 RepID=UPI003F192F86
MTHAKHSNQKWLEFYRKLGYLLYAIAAADREITAEEIGTLKKEVKDKWLTFDESTDEFDSDAAFQVEAVFDWLQEEMPRAAKAYERFEAFVKEHPDFFNAALKKRIMETADHVAASFRNKNKAELSILSQLSQLFNKTAS